MGISEEKADARTTAFTRRKPAFAAVDSAAANTQLVEHVHSLGAPTCVAAYMPIRTEISPLDAMHELHKRGVAVAVPVIVGAGLPLAFARWTPTGDMVVGEFGAQIPEVIEPLQPEVVITPLAAFDSRGYRVGYGGGFYDRSFEELHAAGLGTPVGFAFAAQELDVVPTEPTDVRLHSIVTELGITVFGN